MKVITYAQRPTIAMKLSLILLEKQYKRGFGTCKRRQTIPHIRVIGLVIPAPTA